MCFRPLSSRNCLASNTGELQTFPEDLTFKSRQCVSLHILSLVNTFLGHTATAHEEAGCGSVFESAGCYTVFILWRRHSTANGAEARDFKVLVSFRNANGWRRTSPVRSEKIQIGWIFKQLLGLPALWSTKWKMRIFPSRLDIQVDTHGVSRISKKFPDRSRLTGSLLQKKLDRRDDGMLLYHSLWVLGPFQWSQSQGKLRLKNDLQASTYK